MKIYVDFDRTLFNCDKFLEDVYALINKYNISKSMFKEYQNYHRRKGFNPHIILNELEKRITFDKNVYQEIDNLIHSTSDYLYSDAIPFLEYLKSLNFEIVILTKGNSDYQREKIFNAHIDKYYDKLIVTMRHKGLLLLNYSHSIFVDDNPKEIESLMKRKPKQVIRMARVDSKYSEVNINYDIVTVNSLQEIIDKKILG